MNEILTVLYTLFMVAWALALCVTLQKLLPFTGSLKLGAILPRMLIFILLFLVVAATMRHLGSWETKPEELLLAGTLCLLFWWVLWFHRKKFGKLDSYFS